MDGKTGGEEAVLLLGKEDNRRPGAADSEILREAG
jgi:hypothetical protein